VSTSGSANSIRRLDQLQPPAAPSTIEQLAQARALHNGIVKMKKTKKTLKLSLETIRRLDLDAASGGYHHVPMYSRGGSCGIACTFGPDGPATHSLNPSCGIACTIGPGPNKPHSFNPSCGIVCF